MQKVGRSLPRPIAVAQGELRRNGDHIALLPRERVPVDLGFPITADDMEDRAGDVSIGVTSSPGRSRRADWQYASRTLAPVSGLTYIRCTTSARPAFVVRGQR